MCLLRSLVSEHECLTIWVVGEAPIGLDSRSPLELACGAVGDGDEVPHLLKIVVSKQDDGFDEIACYLGTYHWADIGCRLREDSCPVAQVRIFVGLDGVVIRRIPVISENIRLRDDKVGLFCFFGAC